MSTFADVDGSDAIRGGTDETIIGNDEDHLLVYSKMNLQQMQQIRSLLYDLKEELQKINIHLSSITELEVEAGD